MNINYTSDSASLPTDEILKAMTNAEGASWIEDKDITLNKLLEKSREITGKEAAILVPSGIMGNIVAAITHAEEKRWGSEVILGESSHNYWYEVAGISKIAGLSIRNIDTKDGHITADLLKEAIRPNNISSGPISTMLWTENPSMLKGGTVFSVENMKSTYMVAKEAGMHVHLDGARLFNAAIALKVEPKEVTKWCDSVVFSLSKTLSCPVGSILCGSSDFIERAKRNRKMIGGKMSKAGVIAAAGLVALDKMVDRISDDHKNAKILAEGISRLMPGSVNLSEVQVNIVRVNTGIIGISPVQFKAFMAENGIDIITIPGGYARFVTNRHVTREDIYKTLEVIEKVVTQCSCTEVV